MKVECERCRGDGCEWCSQKGFFYETFTKKNDRRLDAIQSMGWTVELDCNSITIGKGEDVIFFDGGDYIEKAFECVLYGDVKEKEGKE